MSKQPARVLWFVTLSRGDVALVGGRNSSLGEMVPQLGRKGVTVPCGFATSADACRAFLAANALPSRIADRLQRWRNHKLTLHEAGIQRCAMILAGDRPRDIKADIRKAYHALSQRAMTTAFPSPSAPRPPSITRPTLKGFDDSTVAFSIGVQRLVRSDTGGSGVLFSIDTENGFDQIVPSPPPGDWATPSSRARSIPTNTRSSIPSRARCPRPPSSRSRLARKGSR